MAFDLSTTGRREDPVRCEIRTLASVLFRPPERLTPRIRMVRHRSLRRVGRSNVLPDSVVLVSVDSPLTLLEIDRIRRHVPVDHCVAVLVKIEPFLA
jgi:hypothetical protein